MTKLKWDSACLALIALAWIGLATFTPHPLEPLWIAQCAVIWGAIVLFGFFCTGSQRVLAVRRAPVFVAGLTGLLAGGGGLWAARFDLGYLGLSLLLLTWTLGRAGSADYRLARYAGLIALLLHPAIAIGGQQLINDNVTGWCKLILDELGIVVLTKPEQLITQHNFVVVDSLAGLADLGPLLAIVALVGVLARRSAMHVVLMLCGVPLSLALAKIAGITSLVAARISIPMDYGWVSVPTGVQLLLVASTLLAVWWWDRILKLCLLPIPTIEPEYGPVFDVYNVMFYWPNPLPDQFVDQEAIKLNNAVDGQAPVNTSLNTLWSTALEELSTRPLILTTGSWDCLISWFTSRRHVRLALWVTPCLVVAGLGLYVQIVAKRPHEIADEYLVRVENQVAESRLQMDDAELSAASSHTIDADVISPESALILQRILQENPSNRRASYLVATYYDHGGRKDDARKLMRKIAPRDAEGFELAHAWLAADALAGNRIQNPEELKDFVHDLELGSQNEQVNPMLRGLYVQYLLQKKRLLAAFRLLESMAAQDPKYWLQVVELAKLNEHENYETLAAQRIAAIVAKEGKTNAESARDVLLKTYLAIIQEEYDVAIETARRGRTRFSDNIGIKLALSNAFLAKKIGSDQHDESTQNSLLASAMQASDVNARLAEHLALALWKGTQSSQYDDYVKRVAERGIATAKTYRIMGYRCLLKEDYVAALPYLRMVLRFKPDDAEVLNNIAISLIRGVPDNPDAIDKARHAVATALAISGPNAEYLDTQGFVFRAAGDYQQAIVSFEQSLSIDPTRKKTRQELVNTCLKAGLDELAKVHQSQLRESTNMP